MACKNIHCPTADNIAKLKRLSSPNRLSRVCRFRRQAERGLPRPRTLPVGIPFESRVLPTRLYFFLVHLEEIASPCAGVRSYRKRSLLPLLGRVSAQGVAVPAAGCIVGIEKRPHPRTKRRGRWRGRARNISYSFRLVVLEGSCVTRARMPWCWAICGVAKPPFIVPGIAQLSMVLGRLCDIAQLSFIA